jgi:hypothetical protein
MLLLLVAGIGKTTSALSIALSVAFNDDIPYSNCNIFNGNVNYSTFIPFVSAKSVERKKIFGRKT